MVRFRRRWGTSGEKEVGKGGLQEEEKEPHLLLEAFVHVKAFVAVLELTY